jgi:hypothetical protein
MNMIYSMLLENGITCKPENKYTGTEMKSLYQSTNKLYMHVRP